MPPHSSRPREKSRCTITQSEKLIWHRFRDEDGTRVVAGELKAYLDAAATRSDRISRLAELEALFEDAALGLLATSGEQTKPITKDPELWELRWATPGDGAELWRMYHGEPHQEPRVLVALRVHRKHIGADRAETTTAQNSEINHAIVRYTLGRRWRWGLI